MSQWIDVKQELPPVEEVVDIWCVWPITGKGGRTANVTRREDGLGSYWTGQYGHIDDSVITHWQHLPAPPDGLVTETPTQIATELGASMHREFGYD